MLLPLRSISASTETCTLLKVDTMSTLVESELFWLRARLWAPKKALAPIDMINATARRLKASFDLFICSASLFLYKIRFSANKSLVFVVWENRFWKRKYEFSAN